MRSQNPTVVVEALHNKDSLTAVEAMMILVQKNYLKSRIDFPKIDEVLSYVVLDNASKFILGLLKTGKNGLERAIFRRDNLPNIRVEIISPKDVQGSQAVALVFHGDNLIQTVTRKSVMQEIKF